MDVRNLTARFVDALVVSLNARTDVELAAAWYTPESRTRFYRTNLFTHVAEDLEYDLRPELLLVDYAFVHRELKVPLVFIESENAPFTASQEVAKLAQLRAPLRVLFSVAEWTPSRELWPLGGGDRDKLLSEWREVAARHAQVYGGPGGALLAIVGEWRPDQTLVFHLHDLQPDSDLSGVSEGIIWQRKMSVSQSDAALQSLAIQPRSHEGDGIGGALPPPT